jgi:hypothetical protein
VAPRENNARVRAFVTCPAASLYVTDDPDTGAKDPPRQAMQIGEMRVTVPA